MNTDRRSCYTAVFTVFLDGEHRERFLEYARWLYGPTLCERAGSLITHALEQGGRNALVDADRWHRAGKPAGRPTLVYPGPAEQGGLEDGEG